jgi:hypothetical protein
MHRETHEMGSKSTRLEMSNNPQMNADYIRVEIEAVKRR